MDGYFLCNWCSHFLCCEKACDWLVGFMFCLLFLVIGILYIVFSQSGNSGGSIIISEIFLLVEDSWRSHNFLIPIIDHAEKGVTKDKKRKTFFMWEVNYLLFALFSFRFLKVMGFSFVSWYVSTSRSWKSKPCTVPGGTVSRQRSTCKKASLV